MSAGENKPVVSVVVPARNAAETLPALFDALERQTLPAPEFEVLVVDDGSTDSTLTLARAAPRVRVVSANGAGVYAARNAGIAAARTNFLALTDADCLPDTDWLERGLERIQNDDSRILAGHIEAPLGPRPGLVSLLDVSHYYDQERYAAEGHAAAGNLWVARRVIEAIGPFNESLQSGGDTEFGRRATEAGYLIEYAPNVRVSHKPVRRARSLVRRSFRLGRGSVQRGQAHASARLRRGAYVTAAGIRTRLVAAGHSPSGVELASLLVAKQLLIRMPLLAGNVSGRLGARQDRDSGKPGPRRGAIVDPALDRKSFEQEFHDQQFQYDTRAFFRRFYEVTSASRRQYEDFLFARSGGRDVLEYGCSDDPFVLKLARRGARGVGIDLSPVAITQARIRAQREGVSSVRFEVMDGEDLEFADASFDVVCGTGVLHHLEIERAFAEIARVLRPGGSAIFIEPLGHNPALRVFRALTPRFRTRDEHPLAIADIDLARRRFELVNADFHHLLGLAAFPLRHRRSFPAVLDRLDRADRALFAHCGPARSWAWLLVLTLQDPVADPR